MSKRQAEQELEVQGKEEHDHHAVAVVAASADDDEEQKKLQQIKHEEALEILSLKRILSSFINYPDAAERDVKRFESYFRRLPPAHKALLSNYSSKLENMRRCISTNSFFIYHMLQAFEPPMDMTQGMGVCEDEVCTCILESTSDIMLGSITDHAQGNNSISNLQNECTDNEVIRRTGKEFKKDKDEAAVNDLKRDYNQTAVAFDSVTDNNAVLPRDWMEAASQLKVSLIDVDKVRCTLRSIVRDWSIEGQKERDECYKPILEELASLFPNRHQSRPYCLVPGAGLGRLAWDISCLGFISQGNEFSYYMMICSNFILNDSQKIGEWTIYPWIHSNCNSLSDSDQFRPVLIPDVVPSSGGTTEGFSMCGGDFVEVYSDPGHVGAWDSVVTCFFIDTAHNIVEYIEIISNILKEGGVWINLGPLLYHFADTYGEDDLSIELSLEDVKKLAFDLGFELEKESTIETTYTTNNRSMMQNRYFAAFWTMRKKTRKEHASAALAAQTLSATQTAPAAS